jgi:ABC-type nickel/cobalt efflux system permease component RcnA
MRRLPRLALIALFLLAIHVFVPAAAAHPLGNFTINHYAGLHVTRDQVTIDYVLDMAEIPAFQEISIIDQDSDGVTSSAEAARYHPEQCEAVRADLVLRAAGLPVPTSLISSAVEFPPGQGGLPTLRLSCGFRAELGLSGLAGSLEFENGVFPARLGWREIVVTGEGVSLQGDFATTSLSNRLVAYPEDLLESPLDQRKVSFELGPSSSKAETAAPVTRAGANPLPVDRNDAFTRLIQIEEITFPVLLLALAISFVWGGMHALTPGHGKTIVGAYLVGTRGTARHALYLGLATTITHTAGVFALGLLTLFASRFFAPEKLFPWLNLISGLLVLGIGMQLFFSRLRSARTARVQAHSEFPEHEHVHEQSHAHASDQAHSHGHSHDHFHDRPHAHAPGQLHEHVHDHGPSGHSHLPPGADGSPVTLRSLLALGISGGLLPCPSALVVMLSAIALGRVGFGMALVVAFSLGLAGVLTAIGVFFIYTRRFFDRFPAQRGLVRALPAASALFIALLGLGITARALIALGLVRL